MSTYYPPAGFHFLVEFYDIDEKDRNFKDVNKDSIDIRFQSVAGLSVDIQTESFKEGGEHRFEHIIPIRTKYNNLVLKRGLVTSSKLIKWCQDTFQSLIISPKNAMVFLLNEKHEPLLSWNVVHVWPKKWSVSDFNAEQNSLVIETLEMQYQYFIIQE